MDSINKFSLHSTFLHTRLEVDREKLLNKQKKQQQHNITTPLLFGHGKVETLHEVS